ncbi:MAG: hypothetical protein HIU92_05100 [Proteobacteria bacterium]|nr:hypothetical protein [Pseudomonadota bacterium]
MSWIASYVKPFAAMMVLVGLGVSLSGCIIVTPRPSYCYYHPYAGGC